MEFFTDPIGTIANFLKDFIANVINMMFGWVFDFIGAISVPGLDSGFQQLFGGGSQMYEFADAVCDVAIKPIAGSILALVMLVQLINITGKMDSNGTLPAMREIVTLAVFAVIFTFLIAHSDELCEAIYNVILQVIQSMNDAGLMTDELTRPEIVSPDDVHGLDWGVIIGGLVMALLCFLVGLIAWVISFVMVYARAIQIYVMMAFSPIPMALMGLEQTRSYGVGFLKNFVAVCLAGAIMLFLIIAFPYICNAVVAFGDGGSWADGFAVYANYGKVLVVCILLVLSLIKSGQWARDVFGG